MPFGILVLGILMLLGGLFSLLWGLGLSGVGGLSWLTGLIFSDSIQNWGGSAFWGGLWSMFVGVLQIVTAFGLFARKQWAWLLALISVLGSALTTYGLDDQSFSPYGGGWAQFGQFLSSVSWSIGFAAIVLAASYALTALAARLDLDRALADR